MTRQTDKSKQLTDKASQVFDVADGYERGSAIERGMSRDEAVECLPDAVVAEEAKARPYLETATTREAAVFIGSESVDPTNWELFRDPE